MKIALLIMDYSESEDGEGYLVDGHGKLKDGKLFLDRGTDTDFPVPEDTYDRIKPVTQAQAQIVGDAQFLRSLRLAQCPMTIKIVPPLASGSHAVNEKANPSP